MDPVSNAVAARSVYLIRWGQRHKIGVSATPRRRIWEVTDGEDAELLHVITSTNPYQVENALHRQFSACSDGGEWFFLAAADVAAICRLARTDSADDLPDSLRPAPFKPNRARSLGKVVLLNVEIDPDLNAAIEAHMRREDRTKKSVISLALKKYLAVFGDWPPKQQ